MNKKKIENFLDQYKDRIDIYRNFAEKVKYIIEEVLESNGFKYQNALFRVKEINSLKNKLLRNKSLKNIKNIFEIQDLAGCRIIFYLDSDIQKFRNYIYREFDVVDEELKYSDDYYNADHFIVKLKEDRLKLTEYLKYKNLLCEIQLTTVLFHAWSEMAHNTIYKDEEKLSEFGGETYKSLEKSLRNIMKKYLKKANYEFESFYKNFERLRLGKKIFSQQFFEEIKYSSSLNEIYEHLSILYNYLYDYDDDKIPKPHNLIDIVRQVLKNSKKLKQEAIKIYGGEITGYNYKDIISSLLNILELFRYKYISEVIDISFDLSLDKKEVIRKKALELVRKTAQYNFQVLNKIGYQPQIFLLEKIETFSSPKKIKYIIPICELTKELLSTEFEGNSMPGYNTFALQFGPLSVNKELKNIRRRSIVFLKKLYMKLDILNLKIKVIESFKNATILPIRGGVSDEMREMVLDDTNYIIDFFLLILPEADIEVIRNIDEQINSYKRELNNNKLISLKEIQEIIKSNTEYNIYRVLVGYIRGYFGEDYDTEKKYREEKIQEFVDEISLSNYNLWKKRIITAIKKPHNEFYYLQYFLNILGKQKPKIAIKLLNEEALKDYFLPLVSGIWQSELKEEVKRIISSWIEKEINLAVCLGVYKSVSEIDLIMINDIFKIAKKKKNLDLLNEIINVIAIIKNVNLKDLFLDTVRTLTQSGSSNWTRYYFGKLDFLLTDMKKNEIAVILDNLIYANNISYNEEEILKPIAEKYPKRVIEFFLKRMVFSKGYKLGSRYYPVPSSLGDIALCFKKKDIVKLMLKKFDKKKGSLNIWIAGLIKNIFQDFEDLLERELIEIVNSREEKRLYIIFNILNAYEGKEFLFSKDIGKEIIKKYYSNSKVRKHLISSLSRTGVVSGEYGFVEALERKKELIQGWQKDEGSEIKSFTEEFKYILDKQIVYEKKRADEDIIERKLDFGKDIGADDND